MLSKVGGLAARRLKSWGPFSASGSVGISPGWPRQPSPSLARSGRCRPPLPRPLSSWHSPLCLWGRKRRRRRRLARPGTPTQQGMGASQRTQNQCSRSLKTGGSPGLCGQQERGGQTVAQTRAVAHGSAAQGRGGNLAPEVTAGQEVMSPGPALAILGPPTRPVCPVKQ